MKTIKSNFPIFIFLFLLFSLNIQPAQGEIKEEFELNIVKAWGWNTEGQLGNDKVGTNPEGIVDVLGLENVVDVAAGYVHSIALTEDGQVWAWGNNIEGQIGVGKQGAFTPDIPLPVRVFGPYETDADDDGKPDGGTYLTDIVAIATSDCHNLALSSSGKVYAWGENHKGQCGCDEKWNNKITPVEVMGKIGDWLFPISGIIAIATGSNHSMALTSDGQVYTWGYNYRGQLGNPSITDASPYFWISKTAVKVWANEDGTPLTGVKKIGAGTDHSFAIVHDGNAAAWGENKKGQLGIGYFGDKEDLPVNVININNIIAIDGGKYHSIGLCDDGSVYSWGDNTYGQLGNGKVNNGIIDPRHDPYEPDFVHGENDTGHLSCIRKIAVGRHHNLVIRNKAFSGDYEVMAWGKNGQGEVDAGTGSDPYPLPIIIPNLDKRGKKVAAGSFHSLAIVSGVDENDADLVPVPIIIVEDVAKLRVGITITFDSGVSNLGNMDSGIFNVKWLINGQDLGYYGSHTNVPGRTIMMDGNSAMKWTPEKPGEYKITFIVDVDDHVTEYNEYNNQTNIIVSVDDGFVEVRNDSFYLDEQPFKFVGVNIRELSAFYFRDKKEKISKQLEAAEQMGARVVRFFGANKHRKPSECIASIQYVLDQAMEVNPAMKFIIALTDFYDNDLHPQGDDDWYNQYLDPEWFSSGYLKNYEKFVEEVVSAFKNNSQIMAWELGNELSSNKSMLEFAYDMGHKIRGWAPRQLVTTGFLSVCHATGQEACDHILPQFYDSWNGSPSPFDFLTVHAYNNRQAHEGCLDGVPRSCHHNEDADQQWAQANSRPYIVEEAGFSGAGIDPHFPGGTWEGTWGREDIPDCTDDRGPAIEATMNIYFDGLGCDGFMQWGFMWGDEDLESGDHQVGMDWKLGHTDWDSLSDVYKARAYNLRSSGNLCPVCPCNSGIDNYCHHAPQTPGLLPD